MRKLVIPKYFGRPSIGLALFGCTNRPFYQICVFPDSALGRRYESSILEQIGTFDPLPNVKNEKLVALNYGRLKYWIGERNAHISVPVLELLGLSGLFPIHPKTFIRAKNNRELLESLNTPPEAEVIPVIMADVVQKKKYQCMDCVKSYETPHKLKQHIRHNHMGLYKCEPCGEQYNTAPELRKHNASNHPKIHRCEICPYSHVKKYMLTRHIRQSHDSRAIICDIEGCNMSFSKYRRLQHFRDHHPGINATDEFETVAEHVVTVRKEKAGPSQPRPRPYICGVDNCARNFRTPQERDDHENRHKGGIPPYTCNWCELKYYARRELARHLKDAHRKSIKEAKYDRPEVVPVA